MSTTKPKLTYTERVPWKPQRLRLAAHGGAHEKLYVYRDAAGNDWWSDGYAMFRGTAPAYLRQAYVIAKQAVGVPITRTPPMLARARDAAGSRLELPVASYQLRSPIMSRPLPLDVFAAAGDEDPELHVDARYLAYARDRFDGCSFWRLLDTHVAVRDRCAQELVGIIPARKPPRPPRARSTP